MLFEVKVFSSERISTRFFGLLNKIKMLHLKLPVAGYVFKISPIIATHGSESI
jgi:hypothetical protein